MTRIGNKGARKKRERDETVFRDGGGSVFHQIIIYRQVLLLYEVGEIVKRFLGIVSCFPTGRFHLKNNMPLKTYVIRGVYVVTLLW